MERRKEIIEVLMSEWIIILNLTNWEISFNLVSEKELQEMLGETQGTILGCNNYDYYSKKSTISFLEDMPIKEVKNTVIHELLHLVFSEIDRIEINTSNNKFRNRVYVDALEVAVNSLSKAFIMAGEKCEINIT